MNYTFVMIKYFNILKLCYSCDGKAEFSASLLQSSVSHDLAEIILIWWYLVYMYCIYKVHFVLRHSHESQETLFYYYYCLQVQCIDRLKPEKKKQ